MSHAAPLLGPPDAAPRGCFPPRTIGRERAEVIQSRIRYAASGVSYNTKRLGVLLLVLLTPTLGRAQLPAEDALAEARRSEHDLSFEEAHALYEAAARSGAGTRAGRLAEQRAAHLEARRDPGGGFMALTMLEQMRRGEATEERLSAFETEVEEMSPGPVRDDALFLLGESWFRRLETPYEAIPLYERLLASETLGSAQRQTAVVALAEARAAIGETDDALRVLEREGLDDTFEGQALSTAAARRTARIVASAFFILGCALLLMIGRPWRADAAMRERITWRRILALLYVIGVPALIAELYEPTMSHAFLIYGAIAAPLLALTAASALVLARRSAPPSSRAALVAALIVTQLAAAWLALDMTDGLGTFGL